MSAATASLDEFVSRIKKGFYVLEGMNSFVTVYYFYYFYFFMQKAFGFENKANLGLAALNGATYMFGAWWGGRFAERAGAFKALKLGFGTMMCALYSGLFVHSAPGHIAVMVITVIGMSLTWPTLEASVSYGEGPARLPYMLGIYNVLWAGTGALAYFTGGALLDRLGLRSMFYVPATILLGQLGLTFWLERQSRLRYRHASEPGTRSQHEAEREVRLGPSSSKSADEIARVSELNPRPIAKAKRFLRMAWLANPFAYIAINTLLAVMPGVAGRLGLSTTLAGVCCSVWCFARLGSFWTLWLWTGWHYRFRWLLTAYICLVLAFAVILLFPSLTALVIAQIFFGGAVGLIYYSSLFYSMDAGDTKSEHGGIHEAAIGLGNFAGPTVGAASLHFLPQYANGGALAVSALLLCGLGGLVVLSRQQ